MNTTRALTFLLIVLRLSPAGAICGESTSLESAIRSQAERSGDLDALAAEWIRRIEESPLDRSVELLARRLSSIRPVVRDEPALVPLLERVLAASPGPRGLGRQVLVDTLSDLYRMLGREDDRERLEEGRGFVRDWLVAGPFGKGRRALLRVAFPPEEDQDPSRTYRDGWQEIRWRKASRRGLEPATNPLDWVHPDNGIVYLMAHVKLDDERVVALHRGSADSLRIWWNGTLVADDDMIPAFRPNRRTSAVRAGKGWNRILVKTRGTFWVRLSDPAGDPFPPGALEVDSEGTARPVESPPDPRSADPIPPGTLESWASWVDELGRSAEGSAPAPELVDALLGLATLQDIHGRDDLAVRSAEKALQISPDDPFALFHAGNVFRSAGHWPPNVSKNRAKACFEGIVSRDPDFVPAYERLARFLAEDQQYLPAIEMVRKGLSRNPVHLPLLLRLQGIHQAQGWETQEIEAVAEIEKASPASAVPPAFRATFHRRLENGGKALELSRLAFERDRRRTDLLLEIASIHRSRGELEPAVAAAREAVRLDPDGVHAADRLARILADAGLADEAVAVARELARRNPDDPAGWSRIGEILLRSGDLEGSRAAYEKAAALDPGDLNLERYLTSLRAGEADRKADRFWEPWDERLEDWIPMVPTEGPVIAKAASITVLDISVVRFEIDGSHSEYVHQAHKLLSEESKEDLARISTGEETLSLRTISPSGQVLEPVPAEGRGSFVMPGLVPGAFVEVAYRDGSPGGRGEPLDPRSFYFQDTRFKSPFLLSRYVLLVPEGLDLAMIETNLGPDSRPSTAVAFADVKKTVTPLDGGGVALVWETRDARRLEPEPLMPESQEYIPNVEVLGKRTWADIGATLRESWSSNTKLTPEIEDAARGATRGIEDPLERARALYAHVTELVTTDSGPSQAVAVLLEKAGNRNILYKALLDAAGVRARWEFLRPREEFLPRGDWSVPRLGTFTYPFVRVEADGRDPVHVSLVQRGTPFGLLPEQLDGGKALVIEPDAERIEQLPAADPARSATTTSGTIRLAAGTELRAELQIVSRAFAAYAQKDRLRTLPAFQKDLALRTVANRLFPGSKVETAEMRGLDAPEEPFAMAVTLTAPKGLQERGDDALLRAVFQPAQLVRSFCSRPRRDHPLHFRTQFVVRDSVRVDPDPGRTAAVVPADVTLTSPLGSYALVFRKDGESLEIRRDITLLPGRLAPEEFGAFVEFCRTADAAEQEVVVFRAKG